MIRALLAAAALSPFLVGSAPAQSLGAPVTLSGYVIDAQQTRPVATGGVVLSGATLTRPGRDGEVVIRQLELPDLDLLPRLLPSVSGCDPTGAASGEILARDVRFRPDPDLGATNGREEIRLALVTLRMSRIGCSWRLMAEVDGVTISGVDGSRIDIMGLDMRSYLSGPELHDLEVRIDLSGIGLEGPEGPGGLRLDEAGVTLVADLSEDGLWARAGSGAPLANLMSLASATVSRAGFRLSGIELVPELFLPERDLLRIGLEPGSPISGEVALSASLESGDFRIRGLSELSGLFEAELDLVGSLPEPGARGLPRALSGALPVPVELLGISLESVTLRYEELGISAIAENMSGQTLAALIDALLGPRIDRVATRLPGGLSQTVTSGREAVMGLFRDGGGAAGLRPDEPFSLLDLALSGMMGPDPTAARTGAWREN